MQKKACGSAIRFDWYKAAHDWVGGNRADFHVQEIDWRVDTIFSVQPAAWGIRVDYDNVEVEVANLHADLPLRQLENDFGRA